MREEMEAFFAKHINSGTVPGAAVHVSLGSDVLLRAAFGNRISVPSPQPMELSTVFDLASLTKVVAVLPAILKLAERNAIRLDTNVSFYLPAFQQLDKKDITVEHLLIHTSGLPPYLPLYQTVDSGRSAAERIAVEPLAAPTGGRVIYSDLNFILLGEIIELVTGSRLSDFLQAELFSPADMHYTSFNPELRLSNFAATEFSERHGTYKCGIVHDENAEAMGGVSGHAGLFSTIDDLGNFAAMISNGGVFNGRRILEEHSLRLAANNHTADLEEQRGLSWMKGNSPSSPVRGIFSAESYGHNGFTGTSMWFDPERKLSVILLTNRVHISREQHAIHALRRKFHALICSLLDA